ncbi:MAG: hypothetical protein GC136_08590 [Alphaproteobacteria bacterium]|nr:hypothetical protein [Alphaproteobacteria bacterium]
MDIIGQHEPELWRPVFAELTAQRVQVSTDPETIERYKSERSVGTPSDWAVILRDLFPLFKEASLIVKRKNGNPALYTDEENLLMQMREIFIRTHKDFAIALNLEFNVPQEKALKIIMAFLTNDCDEFSNCIDETIAVLERAYILDGVIFVPADEDNVVEIGSDESLPEFATYPAKHMDRINPNRINKAPEAQRCFIAVRALCGGEGGLSDTEAFWYITNKLYAPQFALTLRNLAEISNVSYKATELISNAIERVSVKVRNYIEQYNVQLPQEAAREDEVNFIPVPPDTEIADATPETGRLFTPDRNAVMPEFLFFYDQLHTLDNAQARDVATANLLYQHDTYMLMDEIAALYQVPASHINMARNVAILWLRQFEGQHEEWGRLWSHVISRVESTTRWQKPPLSEAELPLHREAFTLAADVLKPAQMRILDAVMGEQAQYTCLNAYAEADGIDPVFAKQAFGDAVRAVTMKAVEAGRMDLVAHISGRSLQFIS